MLQVPAPVGQLARGRRSVATASRRWATTPAPTTCTAQRRRCAPALACRPHGHAEGGDHGEHRQHRVGERLQRPDRGDARRHQLEPASRTRAAEASRASATAPTITPMGRPNRMAPCWSSPPNGYSQPVHQHDHRDGHRRAGHEPRHPGHPKRGEGAHEHQRRQPALDEAKRAVADRDDQERSRRGSRSIPRRTARARPPSMASPARTWLAGPRKKFWWNWMMACVEGDTGIAGHRDDEAGDGQQRAGARARRRGARPSPPGGWGRRTRSRSASTAAATSPPRPAGRAREIDSRWVKDSTSGHEQQARDGPDPAGPTARSRPPAQGRGDAARRSSDRGEPAPEPGRRRPAPPGPPPHGSSVGHAGEHHRQGQARRRAAPRARRRTPALGPVAIRSASRDEPTTPSGTRRAKARR